MLMALRYDYWPFTVCSDSLCIYSLTESIFSPATSSLTFDILSLLSLYTMCFTLSPLFSLTLTQLMVSNMSCPKHLHPHSAVSSLKAFSSFMCPVAPCLRLFCFGILESFISFLSAAMKIALIFPCAMRAYGCASARGQKC